MAKERKRAPGELRLSQLVTTYGPGAMVDLPRQSVIVGGLDFWHGERRPIYEERLATAVARRLGLEEVAFYEPPVVASDPTLPVSGVTCFLFPTWFVAQVEEKWVDPESGRSYRTRPLVPYWKLVKGGYLRSARSKPVPVVPVRFVRACVKGHIADVDWYGFVHQGENVRDQLWLDEGGAGNDFSEIFVRSEATKKRRPLSDAAVPKARVLGRCPGRSPWLGPHARNGCQEDSRLLVRSASNAYFALTMNAIAIPDQEAKLREAVDRVWEDFLQYAEELDDVRRDRRKEKVRVALEGFGDEAVWAEVERRKTKRPEAEKGLKEAEIETLLAQPDEIGEDVPEGDFYARNRRCEGQELAPRYRDTIERVVLVHRLREVVSQIGFTRFEVPASVGVDDEVDVGVEVAPLAEEQTWVPAVENRGEGVFLAFREEAIRAWCDREEVCERERQLAAGFDAWCKRRQVRHAVFPGLPFVMLHTLSHLLITAVSLECGYAASAIRERVYALPSLGHGILLYTGSPGSEGTLGGLVQVGRRIEQHLDRALELGRLCSNDPVCAQHTPSNMQEERFLHGAACHGCLLIAETSCDHRNDLLDRALVVPTVEGLKAELCTDV